MSSTKRGGKRSTADWYGTPTWSVKRLLERLQLPGGSWFEPGFGDGSIIETVNSVRNDVEWFGVEKRKTSYVVKTQSPDNNWRLAQDDFLKPKTPAGELLLKQRYDVILGNPPYRLAQAFLDRSLAMSTWVVFLLRVNFLGSEDRSDFMRTHAPDLYVLPNRPSFKRPLRVLKTVEQEQSKRRRPRGKNQTDSIEYAWFCWGPERERAVGQHQVLNSTPLAERRNG